MGCHCRPDARIREDHVSLALYGDDVLLELHLVLDACGGFPKGKLICVCGIGEEVQGLFELELFVGRATLELEAMARTRRRGHSG